MSKNITIQEGGVGRQFTADKLKTALVGGGSCNWVPEDEVGLSALSVTENGTYSASDEGSYGYSQVNVNVPGGAGGPPGGAGSSVIGTDPETGNDELITVENDNTITTTVLPSKIAVTELPDVTTFRNGYAIDFTGIEVKAYTENDEEVESIPFEELIFPVTVADLDEAEGDRWSDGSGVNAMLIAYTQKWFVDWKGQDEQVYTSQILGEYNGKPFMWGGTSGQSQPTTFFATNYNGDVYIWASTASRPMNGWVYEEGAAQYQYHMVVGTSAVTGTGEVRGAGRYNEHVKNIPESAKMPNGTEEMYAEAAKQKIPVQWVRQEDGKVLNTYYEITVEGFTPE